MQYPFKTCAPIGNVADTATQEALWLLYPYRIIGTPPPVFAFVALHGATTHGKVANCADMQVAPGDPKHLSVGLNPLTPGDYTVKFRVLSVDGHAVTNQFSFTIRGSR
jgi:methionine-rich copper-binding protein CopC